MTTKEKIKDIIKDCKLHEPYRDTNWVKVEAKLTDLLDEERKEYFTENAYVLLKRIKNAKDKEAKLDELILMLETKFGVSSSVLRDKLTNLNNHE
jgi:hypothetical protein